MGALFVPCRFDNYTGHRLLWDEFPFYTGGGLVLRFLCCPCIYHRSLSSELLPIQKIGFVLMHWHGSFAKFFMKLRSLEFVSLILSALVMGVFWGTWFTLTRS